MAERGAALFLFGGAGGAYEGGLGYLATVRPDGGPRVHPLSPVLKNGDLYLFVLRKSARANDLKLDARYALHAWPQPFGADDSFDDEEFVVRGRATLVDDEALRQAIATAVQDDVNAADVYRLTIDHAQHKSRPSGKLTYERWRSKA
jgi:hypothetical protein